MSIKPKVWLQAAMFSIAILTVACNGGNKESHAVKGDSLAVSGASASLSTLDTIYGCPSHKEMIGSKGDKCPKCWYMTMIPVTWPLEGVDTVRVTSLADYNPPK